MNEKIVLFMFFKITFKKTDVGFQRQDKKMSFILFIDKFCANFFFII